MIGIKQSTIRCAVTIILMIVLTMSLSSSTSASNSISTFVNTKKLVFNTEPIMENGRTLVEFTPIFNALGLNVDWNNSTKTLVGKNEKVKIQLTLGSKTAYVNGNKVALEVAPKVIKGRTFVPLRFISDSMGAEILYHSNVKEIDIYSKEFYGERRTPSKSLKAARGTNWNMSVSEVKGIEKSKLVGNIKEGNLHALKYSPVSKYKYSTELNYYFENNKLIMIVYDFMGSKDYYHTWTEMTYLHDKLHRLATEEYGKGVFTSDDYNFLATTWDLGSSNLMLNVSDKNLYTDVKLIFYPK